MADDEKKKLEEEKKRKQAEIERKRAEVRARMEEASKAKKAKKGFMTPERKKKLRLLLRKKAAEELKKEQERKAAERRRIIEERCGKPKLIDDANEGQLKKIVKDYYDRMYICEEQKWDLEREVRKRDWEIAELNSQVNDLRGKFVKPTLKKVSKYENKFAKLQKKAAEFNFRNQLKVVKKKEFTLEEEDKEKKPDWSKTKDEKKEGEEAPAEGAPGEAPAEGQPPAEEQPAGEGAQPADGQPPTEAQPPAEGQEAQPSEGAPSPEGAPPAEGQPAEGTEPQKEKTPEPPPETGFETFKKLVMNENYDIITLPETILAPTEDKEAVSIPNYSLVENRRGSGDGVIMYVKDSLKYKVVDLTAPGAEHEHLSFEDLLEKLRKNGHAAAAAELESANGAAHAPAEGATPAEGAPAAEGAAEGTPPTEPAAEGAPPAEGTEQAPAAEAPPATEAAPDAEPAPPAEAGEPTPATGAAEPVAATEEQVPAGDDSIPPAEETPGEPESAVQSAPVIEAAA